MECSSAGSWGDRRNGIQASHVVSAKQTIEQALYREGLDYLVTEARLSGIRLIMTLTNGKNDYGGMRQYVQWVNGSSITEFYTNRRIRVGLVSLAKAVKSGVLQRLFKDYIFTLQHRKNTIDGVSSRLFHCFASEADFVGSV